VEFILGLETGIHAGVGVLYLDLRFAGDLGESLFTKETIADITYHRYSFILSAGYSFGIGNR
jgi:hypothetical protein